MALDDRADRMVVGSVVEGSSLRSQRPHRPKARMTRPTTSSGRTKTSFVLSQRRERAGRHQTQVLEPSQELLVHGSARGTERKVQGLSLIKSQPLGRPTVAAPERRPAGARTRVNAGNGSGRRRRRGDGMTTPRVLSTAAPNLRSTAWRHEKVTSWPGAIGFGAAGPASHLLLGRNSCDLGSPAQ